MYSAHLNKLLCNPSPPHLQQAWIALAYLLQQCLEHGWVLLHHLTQHVELRELTEELQRVTCFEGNKTANVPAHVHDKTQPSPTTQVMDTQMVPILLTVNNHHNENKRYPYIGWTASW